MTANSSKIETDEAPAQAAKPRRKPKAKTKRERTGPQADWKHVGGEVPPDLFNKLVARARRDSVPQAAVIRWALADLLMEENGS